MISEESLEQAVKEFDSQMMEQLSSQDSRQHTFSHRFERKMQGLLRREQHPQVYRLLRSACCILLALVLAAGIAFAVSPDVRAAVIQWVREFNIDMFMYAPVEETTGEALIYVFPDPPAGYELILDEDMQPGRVIVYGAVDGKMLTYSYVQASEMWFDPGDAILKTAYVGDTIADLYLSNVEDNSSSIVWTDSETGALLCIDGFFTEDELIAMAEAVYRSDR